MNAWQDEMADIISEVARNLIAKHGSDNSGILLLSDLSLDGVSYNVFVCKDKSVNYSFVIDDDMDNIALIREFKYTAPIESRCEAVELFIQNNKVVTKILYQDDIEPEYLQLDFRDKIIHSYFGNLPIIYPTWPFVDRDL